MRRLLAAAARLGLGGPLARLSPEHALAARAFDRRFYLRTYPDVAEAKMDPFAHFMAFGWRERRDPNAEFSVQAYLEAFPEVEASGVNPFVHYLTEGRHRSGRPESPLGFRFEVIERLAPMEARVAKTLASPLTLGSPVEVVQALSRSRGGLARLHITFSHDDYSANIGGVQLCVSREAARLAEEGRDHLHLHPARAWPRVRTEAEPEGLGVVWNGEALGAFSAEAIVAALRQSSQGESRGRSFAIHSLLGHAVDETVAIVRAAGLTAGTFWLHDFASVCAGFHLMRNDVEDCGAPPPDSPACAICVYGPWRARHVAAHARLFEQLALTVAAPAQVTLEFWRQNSALPAVDAMVLPHATLQPRAPAALPSEDRPFRLAFAGLPVAHKGWMAFRALRLRFADDPRYDFVHLGARRDPGTPVRFEPVQGGPERPLAMRDALQAEAPDAVLVWPLCRETFSFVAYEAVAAGCAVITGPDSGNVQTFVSAGGYGRVLSDEAALSEAFESGEILQMARAQRRPMLYDMAYSALSLDLEGPSTT